MGGNILKQTVVGKVYIVAMLLECYTEHLFAPMNNYFQFFSGLAVMAGVTYLVRMLPLVLVKKKIENRFINSFLYYVPYAVLAVMTVPAIFSSTASLPSAIAGFVVALILAYFERGLLTVAAASCAAVFIAELIMKFIH